MSSVVISGNTSGTITLAAPDVAGTTTLTLPAVSGTLITSGGGYAGSFTTLTSTQDASFATSSGNVGVGTASPNCTFQVNGIVRAATANDKGVISLGESAGGTSANCGLWRGDANSAVSGGTVTTGGNYLNLGGYAGMVFTTGAANIGSQTERLRIGTSGELGLSGANYGTSGQVLTSNGSGAAASWTTISTSPPTTLYAIGTYIVGRPFNSTDYAPNDTVAGSSLYGMPTDAYLNGGNSPYIYNAQQGGARQPSTNLVNTGTWRCMSRAWGNGGDTGGTGLWVRIS